MSQSQTQPEDVISIELDDAHFLIHHETHGKIGYVTVHKNRIVMARIDEEHQHNGYGHEALKQIVDYLEDYYETIKTSTVISNEMQSILHQIGFEPSPHDPSHWEYDTEQN